jgi:two-component system sensor histidine kinase KdpD
VEWIVVHVETPSYAYNKKAKALVAEMMRFAGKARGRNSHADGQDAAEPSSLTRALRISTKIMAGNLISPDGMSSYSDRRRELARKCREIDLYLISGDTQEQPVKFEMNPPKPFKWIGLLWAVAMVCVFTAAGKITSRYLEPENMGMVYLLGVALIAYLYGLRISFIAALLSVLAYDYFFVQPLYTFRVADIDRDLVTFGIILVISLIISILTARLRQRTITMRLRENRTEALYHLTRDLAKSQTP